MRTMSGFESQELKKVSSGVNKMAETVEIPNLEGTGTHALEAWFLGPKGENADELEKLIVEAVRDQVFWRRNFHPGDPSYITDESKHSTEYIQAMGSLKKTIDHS